MGVGKGSVAREVIKISKYLALDTDDLIESMENKKVSKIFETDGEKYFRDLEAKVSNWLEANLKKIGKVVLLDSPFADIIARIKNHPNAAKKLAKRPLLADLVKAQELYDERRPEYLALADVVVDVTNKSAIDSAKEILKKVKR